MHGVQQEEVNGTSDAAENMVKPIRDVLISSLRYIRVSRPEESLCG